VSVDIVPRVFWPLCHIEVGKNFVTRSLYYLKYLTKYPIRRRTGEPHSWAGHGGPVGGLN